MLLAPACCFQPWCLIDRWDGDRRISVETQRLGLKPESLVFRVICDGPSEDGPFRFVALSWRRGDPGKKQIPPSSASLSVRNDKKHGQPKQTEREERRLGLKPEPLMFFGGVLWHG